jgi:hypothetical protein
MAKSFDEWLSTLRLLIEWIGNKPKTNLHICNPNNVYMFAGFVIDAENFQL